MNKDEDRISIRKEGGRVLVGVGLGGGSWE